MGIGSIGGNSPQIQVNVTEDTSEVNNDPTKQTLTVSIMMDPDGPGGLFEPVELTKPLVVPADISLSELEQILKTTVIGAIQNTPFGPLLALSGMMYLGGAISDALDDVVENGEINLRTPEGRQSESQKWEQIEKAAAQTVGQLMEMLNSGRYPDYTDMLKLLIKVGNEMREMASNMKFESLKAEYENTMQQAAALKTKAEENYQAAVKEAKAMITEGIGQILTGVLSIGLSFTALGPAAGQIGGIATGITSIISGAMRLDAAADRLEADLQDSYMKIMEAGMALIRSSQDIADKLHEIAKTLVDFAIRMLQDLIREQHQIAQKANI